MKYLLIFILLMSSQKSLAKINIEQHTTTDLVCAYYSGLSCVSKASIEKDKAELELIKLQIKALKK